MKFWECWYGYGGICPVRKTDEMTQDVGVDQDGRLYTKGYGEEVTDLDERVTALEQGGGGEASLGYFQVGNTEVLDTNPQVFTTLNEYIPDASDRINVSSGKIVIGDGVSVIGLSVSCGIPSAAHSKYYGVSVLKNSNTVASCLRVTGTTSDPTQSDTFEIPMTIIEVSAGDEIQFRVSGGNGEYCSLKANGIIIK